jgi:hypothetical protein
MLNNATDAARSVRISMALENKGDAPVLLAGPLHAAIPPGTARVPFEQEVTLAPGSHLLEFRTETARVPLPPASKDTRDLRFRVFDLKVEALPPQ